MEKARFGSIHGPLVTPEEFIRRATPQYKERGIFPFCDACHEIVQLYAVHNPSPNVTARFDHQDLPPDFDPLDDCILANRTKRFRGMAPDAFDDEQAQGIRAQFLTPDFLAKSYSFCLQLCRKGNLPAKKFQSMLKRAERKRVWAYAGIKVWSIPYILLSLENFTAKTKSGQEYEFHFVFRKPRGTTITALWDEDTPCVIRKVFSSNGDIVKAHDNPFSVSENDFLEKAGDVNWISQNLLEALIPQAWG